MLPLFATLPSEPEGEPDIYDVIVEVLEGVLGLEFAGPAPLPPDPTDYPPGSPEKVELMAWRAERRMQTCHPRDTRSLEGMAFARSRNGRDFTPRRVG